MTKKSVKKIGTQKIKVSLGLKTARVLPFFDAVYLPPQEDDWRPFPGSHTPPANQDIPPISYTDLAAINNRHRRMEVA